MTNPETDRPAAVPPPMSRAAKAEALLLRFTAEAHRRKWNYDRGLDGDGVPVKSEAFDALHRLGEEMRVALEELRRMPAAVSVPPPAPRADVLRWAADLVAADTGFHIRYGSATDYAEHYATLLRRKADEAPQPEADADAVLAVLPEPADRAAVRAAAFDEAAEKLAGLDPVKAALAGQHAWNDAAGIVRHMARQERRMATGEQQPVGPCVAGEQQNETPEAEREPDPDCEHCEGSGLDPDAYFVEGDVWTHAPCSECLPEDDEAEPTAERVKHSGPETKFCVLCLSGEHERVDEPAAGVRQDGATP